MDDYIFVYLNDIRKSILEVESYFVDYPMRFETFEKDYKTRSAVERKVEIMAEAINRIHKIASDFQIPNARGIVDTRNRIIHAYDSVRPEFLWGLVIRHIPNLKKDIEEILGKYLNQDNKR